MPLITLLIYLVKVFVIVGCVDDNVDVPDAPPADDGNAPFPSPLSVKEIFDRP